MRTFKKSVAFILVFALMMVASILPASAASESGIINGVEVTGGDVNNGYMTLFFDVDFAPGTEEYVTHGYGRVYGPDLDGYIFTPLWNPDYQEVDIPVGDFIIGEWYLLEIEAFEYAQYLGSGSAYFQYTGESSGIIRVLGYDASSQSITVYLNVSDFGGENFTQGYAFLSGPGQHGYIGGEFANLNDQGYVDLDFNVGYDDLIVGEEYTIELLVLCVN